MNYDTDGIVVDGALILGVPFRILSEDRADN
jgi:hypothetical protein